MIGEWRRLRETWCLGEPGSDTTDDEPVYDLDLERDLDLDLDLELLESRLHEQLS